MFDHGEVVLHNIFGDEIYWKARRSMRFNKELRQIASDYREKFLNSTDENDNTELPENWKNEKVRSCMILNKSKWRFLAKKKR